jgi:hypothetical protein
MKTGALVGACVTDAWVKIGLAFGVAVGETRFEEFEAEKFSQIGTCKVIVTSPEDFVLKGVWYYHSRPRIIRRFCWRDVCHSVCDSKERRRVRLMTYSHPLLLRSCL